MEVLGSGKMVKSRVALGRMDLTLEDPSIMARASYPESSKPAPALAKTDPSLETALVDGAPITHQADFER